jgi:hypothetical protein
MNINEAYPSKYLSATADIPEDADLILTIREVTTENVGQGAKAEDKPVVYFNEHKKGLILNKTNSKSVAGLYGPETDGWIGKKLALFATEVDFQGEQKLAIRVRLKAPKTAPAAPPTTDELLPEVWDSARAKAELEKVGLTADDLRRILKEKGLVNSTGAPSYVAARDTELVKALVAQNTPQEAF